MVALAEEALAALSAEVGEVIAQVALVILALGALLLVTAEEVALAVRAAAALS